MSADNSAALKAGMIKAKSTIRADLSGRLSRLMGDMIKDMENKIRADVGGMTGNTWTSPAGAIYINGILSDISLGETPLRDKLKKGDRFEKGNLRWDRDDQNKTFKASTQTTGHYQVNDNYEFLESQQSGSNEVKATIVGGTEYEGHEQVADNFAKCQMEIDKYFQQK